MSFSCSLCSCRYWVQASAIANDLLEQIDLRGKISLETSREEGGTEEDWVRSNKAISLSLHAKAKRRQKALCDEQAERLNDETKDQDKDIRRAFIQISTTSKLGLGIFSINAGSRPGRKQSKLREECIRVYGGENYDDIWCPILGQWVDKSAVRATHIYSWANRQESMTAIFGATEEPELFRAANALLLSVQFETKFNKGFYVIAPDVPENAPADVISRWLNSEPKEYKIRIIDYSHPSIDHMVDKVGKRTWRMFDNKRLEFRTSFRPRARNLYYHYCVQILRRAWKEQYQGQTLLPELRKPFWGTAGPYIRRNMLTAFVEELGHSHENLLIGAAEDDDESSAADSKAIMLAAALNQINIAERPPEDGDSEESEEDEEDE